MTHHGNLIRLNAVKGRLRPKRALPTGSSMKLNRRAVEALQPRKDEYVAWDATLPGFGIRVHPTGRKVYVIRYRTEAGTQRKMNIGRADVLQPDEARENARALLAEVANGGDPLKRRKDTRTGMTVQELSVAYTEYLAQRTKPGTQANHRTLWGKHINKSMGSKKVADLAHGDVQDFHQKHGLAHQVNANRCVSLLRAAFNYAERRGWREKHTNPCAEIEFFKEYERQIIVKPDELPRLWHAVESYQPRDCWAARYAIMLLMVSGMRRNEWVTGRKEWVDLERRTYTLPDTKTGPRTIHLAATTVEILKELFARDGSPWIIPNSLGTGPLRGIGRHWGKIRKAAGMNDLRLHDLRHTVGTLGHYNGLSRKDIAGLLGHKRLTTTDRYINSYDERMQDIADIAAAAIKKPAC